MIQGLGLAPALQYGGPERRRQSAENRARRERHQEDEPQRGSGWRAKVPKAFLWWLIGGLGTVAVWMDLRWRAGVDNDVSTLRGEIQAMRQDQLEFYRWQAEAMGYRSVANAYEQKGRLLKEVTP